MNRISLDLHKVPRSCNMIRYLPPPPPWNYIMSIHQYHVWTRVSTKWWEKQFASQPSLNYLKKREFYLFYRQDLCCRRCSPRIGCIGQLWPARLCLEACLWTVCPPEVVQTRRPRYRLMKRRCSTKMCSEKTLLDSFEPLTDNIESKKCWIIAWLNFFTKDFSSTPN